MKEKLENVEFLIYCAWKIDKKKYLRQIWFGIVDVGKWHDFVPLQFSQNFGNLVMHMDSNLSNSLKGIDNKTFRRQAFFKVAPSVYICSLLSNTRFIKEKIYIHSRNKLINKITFWYNNLVIIFVIAHTPFMLLI